jgi:hypothetical protein
MPHEEPHLFSDHRVLFTMSASVNDARDIVRCTQELIEQSRSMLRALDVQHAGHRLNATLPRPHAALPEPPGS